MPARFGARRSARKASARQGSARPRRQTVVFGIFERQGQVYTEIVPDRRCKAAVEPGTVSDGWRDGLVDLGYGRVNRSRDEFAGGAVHGGFRGLAKGRLAKFKGVPRRTFHLHLKETEWRYDHADRPCRQNPLGQARSKGLTGHLQYY